MEFFLQLALNGIVVGSYHDSAFANHSFIRDAAGNFTTFDVPGAIGSSASGTNQQGEIVGIAQPVHPPPYTVGFKRSSSGSVSIIIAPGSTTTNPTAVSSKGRITGSYQDSNGIVHGFVQ